MYTNIFAYTCMSILQYVYVCVYIHIFYIDTLTQYLVLHLFIWVLSGNHEGMRYKGPCAYILYTSA